MRSARTWTHPDRDNKAFIRKIIHSRDQSRPNRQTARGKPEGCVGVVGSTRVDSTREGMREGISLGSYLLLVEYNGRLFREGNAIISREVGEIFERIGTTAGTWQARLERRTPPGPVPGRKPAAAQRSYQAARSATGGQSRPLSGHLRLARTPHVSSFFEPAR